MFSLLAGMVRLILRVYIGRRWHLQGLENVPATGPLLVVANHPSTIDPVLLGAVIPREMHFLAKYELFSNPVKAFFSRSFRAHPLVRHSADRGAIRWALRHLGSGGSVAIFPEGTRVERGELEPGQPGVGFLALKSGAQILPVAFHGTENCIPRGSWLPRPVEMYCTIGRPFELARVTPEGTRTTSESATTRIMVELARLLPPAYQGAYAEQAGAGIPAQ